MATKSPTMLVSNPMEALLSNYSNIHILLRYERGLATLPGFGRLCMTSGLWRARPVY